MSTDDPIPGRARICVRCHRSLTLDPDVLDPDAQVCPDDGGRLLRFTQDGTDRTGEVVDGKVTLLGLLGRGGMGSVYRALQHSMEREVAIKLMSRALSDEETLVKRFLREAKTASKLNHPNVITLFDFGQTPDGELYLMMELLNGQELGDLIHGGRPMSATQAVDIIVQVCDAVQHAHDNGLIHRDIKPDNIFLIDSSRGAGRFVKVLDFGIARSYGPGDSEHLTETGIVCGTPAYMSPEQAMGDEVDARSDVYSIGVVLYEMLCGCRPFDEDTPMKALLAHISKPAPTIREAVPAVRVPSAIEAVVMRTLAKRPGDRPPGAAALARLLNEALEAHNSEPSTAVLRPVDTSEGVEAPPIRTLEEAGPLPSGRAAAGGVEETMEASPAVTRALLSELARSDSPLGFAPVPPADAVGAGTRAAIEAARTRGGGGRWILAILAGAALAGAFAFGWARGSKSEPAGGAAVAAVPTPAAPIAAVSATGSAARTPDPKPAPPAAIPGQKPAPSAERAPSAPPGADPGVPPEAAAAPFTAAPSMDGTEDSSTSPVDPGPPSPIGVRVITDPTDAQVYVDGRKLGSGSVQLAPAAGAVKLTVRRSGYRRRVVTIEPGRTGEVSVVLERTRTRPPPEKKPGPGSGFVPVL